MALEQLANNAATTLSAGVAGTSDPVVFTVTSATGFPTSGNFRVLIGSELLKVTAVSGTSFTASRAQESTTIAAHLNGDAVTHVLTRGSFFQFLAEQNLSDVIANRPPAGQVGRLFFPSGGGVTFRDNGTGWDIWRAGLGPFVPPVADFTTWLNQGSAAFSTASGFGYLSLLGTEAAPNDLKARVKTLPSTTFAMTLAFSVNAPPGGTGICGILIRDSGSGKILTHTMHANSGLFANYEFSGLSNAFVGNDFGDAFKPEYANLFLLRLRGDGTNYYWDHSNDFVNWTNNRTIAIASAYVTTPDQIGFYLASGNVRSNQMNGMSVYHAVLS